MEVKLGEATAAPFEFTWKGVAAGTYKLPAVGPTTRRRPAPRPDVTLLSHPGRVVTPGRRCGVPDPATSHQFAARSMRWRPRIRGLACRPVRHAAGFGMCRMRQAGFATASQRKSRLPGIWSSGCRAGQLRRASRSPLSRSSSSPIARPSQYLRHGIVNGHAQPPCLRQLRSCSKT